MSKDIFEKSLSDLEQNFRFNGCLADGIEMASRYRIGNGVRQNPNKAVALYDDVIEKALISLSDGESTPYQRGYAKNALKEAVCKLDSLVNREHIVSKNLQKAKDYLCKDAME